MVCFGFMVGTKEGEKNVVILLIVNRAGHFLRYCYACVTLLYDFGNIIFLGYYFIRKYSRPVVHVQIKAFY